MDPKSAVGGPKPISRTGLPAVGQLRASMIKTLLEIRMNIMKRMKSYSN